MSFTGSPLLTKSIKYILIATIGIYVFQILPYTGKLILQSGALIPDRTFAHFEIWRLLSYVFLHDAYMPFHLLFNMLMLWMFGFELEQLWGSRRFLIFYCICGAGSGFFSIIHLFNPVMSSMPVIGASGAVLGVMTAYAFYFPERQVLLFFVLPVNIRIVVAGAALISLLGSISSQGIIAHLTHLGGIIIAFFYVKLYPLISRWAEKTAAERRRNTVEQIKKPLKNDDDSFFEKIIDPILAKISRDGMASLTNKERALLKEASLRNKNRLKNGKIIPFDSFR